MLLCAFHLLPERHQMAPLLFVWLGLIRFSIAPVSCPSAPDAALLLAPIGAAVAPWEAAPGIPLTHSGEGGLGHIVAIDFHLYDLGCD